MWENMRFRADREHAGVVAASLVGTVATVGLTMAVVLVSDPALGLIISSLVLLLGFLLTTLVVLLCRPRGDSSSSSWRPLFARREPAESLDYVPRKRRTRRTDYGTQHPPTVEELQDLKQGLNTWVPSGPAPRRR